MNAYQGPMPGAAPPGWTVARTAAAVPGSRIAGDGSTGLASIALDSRHVRPGALFVALPGTRTDGSRFAADAVARGAAAVLAIAPIAGLAVPQIVVLDARIALAEIAAAWYGAPDRDMVLVGVTGTNGKTTVVNLVAIMVGAAGYVGGSLGTLGAVVDGEEIAFSLSRPTTPEPHELRQVLGIMRDEGATLVAMEATSQALALDRVRGLRFAGGVFTNLTEDHLDFHGTLEEYFAAKARLFEGLDERAFAAISMDNPYGPRLAAMTRARVITYARSAPADVRPIEIADVPSIRGRVATPVGEVSLAMPLVGGFNVENALASIATGVGLGMSAEAIGRGLAKAKPIPGRLEPVTVGQDFTVVVDYAHTPDALENVLRAARRMAQGRVVCVVGCGGDRDPFKRPVMGGIATRMADVTVFTSDNPRTEDPEKILDAVVAGATADHPHERIENRRMALRRAIGLAGAGDVVVIAGKGHEPYQEIMGVKHPYDDRIEARAALEERYSSRAANRG